VAWSGEEPVNFSRFEFIGVISGGYQIKVTDEHGEPIQTLKPDEWVLVFQPD
jgi:hypothetical protein